MEITQTDEAWRVTFFPDLRDGLLKDEWAERGYRVQLGITNDPKEPYAPKWVDYDKNAFSIDDVVFYAKNIKECPLCKNLNAEVDVLKRIVIHSDGGEKKAEVSEGEAMDEDKLKKAIRQAIKELKSEGELEEKGEKVSNLFQSMALDFFKSYFTEPGLLMLSIILDEPTLIEEIIPEGAGEKDMLALRALIADYLSGEIGLVRTPEELHEYSRSLKEVLAQSKESVEKPVTEMKSEIDKKLKAIGSEVIFSNI
jgi:hypothetical protein